MPTPEKPRIFLSSKETKFNFCKKLMYKTQDSDNGVIIAVVGRPRSGKSTLATMLGWITDRQRTVKNARFILDEKYFPKDFKLEEGEIMPRVVFKPSHVMRLISEKLARGSVIVWDETGVEGDARDYMSKKNKLLKRTVETIGSKNFILILTAPSIKSFDTGFRRLLTYLIRTSGVVERNGKLWTRAKIYLANPNEFTGEVFFKSLKIKENKFGGEGKLGCYYFPQPPAFIEAPYKRMKELYQTALYQDYADDLDHMDDLSFANTGTRVVEGKKKKLTKSDKAMEMLKANPEEYKKLDGRFDAGILAFKSGVSYHTAKLVVKKYLFGLDIPVPEKIVSVAPEKPMIEEKNVQAVPERV